VKSKARLAAAVVFLLLLIAFFLRDPILRTFGEYLVRSEPPARADLILVLAGDGFGRRILTGAELAKEGYAPKILVSGPSGAYGNYECDLAIPFAVKAGYRESYFVHAEHDGRSTQSEAEILIPRIRAMGAHKVLLVTSNYHTRRAGYLFRRAAPDLEFVVVSAPDEFFSPDDWWRHRDAEKIFLMEWQKTVATWIGL
jgi:uncharacterized SAM-binding protein YcdF (DUF218 family)